MVPKFKSEDRERDFWSNRDSSDYIDRGKAKLSTFPDLKPSTKTICVRLPESMLDSLRMRQIKEMSLFGHQAPV
ncbi:MAG: BrnA antitoxin family protein [Deltaproteobacteria bacterium]|nr:BrnA antitoxin family protein [Deltaproteobacteria bacterium]MDA8307991.1 CopG family antitoxin [Deltaproteobacteria bacterium]